MSKVIPSAQIPVLGNLLRLTPDEEERYSEYQALVLEMEDRGWDQASVINLHPFAITPNGYMHQEKKIPGVTLDENLWKAAPSLELKNGVRIPYIHHVIANWLPTVAETVRGGEGNYSGNLQKRTVLPYELARDILGQNDSPEQKGGVFIYKGSHRPFTQEATAAEEMKLFESAHLAQLNFYDAKYSEADTTFMKQNAEEWRKITMYHRWITQYLIRIGRLAEAPKWFTEILKPGAARTNQSCTSCGAKVTIEANKCKECNFILNPYKAFDNYIIGVTDPGAILVLKRLKEEQIHSLIKAERFTEAELEAIGFEMPSKPKGKTAARTEPTK